MRAPIILKYVEKMSFVRRPFSLPIAVSYLPYLEGRRTYIACYALRKELGYRNSSNPAEKENDLIVAGRQKHIGYEDDGPHDADNILLTLHAQCTEWYERRGERRGLLTPSYSVFSDRVFESAVAQKHPRFIGLELSRLMGRVIGDQLLSARFLRQTACYGPVCPVQHHC